MKIAIIGSRTFENYEYLSQIIQDLGLNISELISGGAKGTDTLAENWAKDHNTRITIFAPDWGKYGIAAGVIRNKKIVEACDFCLIFWDGKSKGTKSSIDFCKKLSKPMKIVLI